MSTACLNGSSSGNHVNSISVAIAITIATAIPTLIRTA
jgi:hypothetical protein